MCLELIQHLQEVLILSVSGVVANKAVLLWQHTDTTPACGCYFHIAKYWLVIRNTFFSPLSVRGWASAFLLAVRRLCGVIEGRPS